MKRFLPIFCLEMLIVFVILFKVYTRWDFSLATCIGFVILAIMLLFVFHNQFEKRKASETIEDKR